MITPISRWEHKEEVREVVFSKLTSYLHTVVFRLIAACLLTAVLFFCFIWILQLKNCEFPFFPYFLGTYLLSCFLGLIGLLFSQIGKNAAVGYLAACGYHSLMLLQVISPTNPLYLFSLTGGIVRESAMLLLAIFSLALIVLFLTVVKRGMDI